jgi:serine/threonine protein kinase
VKQVSDFVPVWFGPYVVLDQVGEGGVGTVHLAKPIQKNCGIPTPVVLKRLHPELTQREVSLKRFRHEVEVAVSLDSQYVCKVYDAGAVAGVPYVAMEYIWGWTLLDLLRAYFGDSPRIPVSVCMGLMLQALDGLAAIHDLRDDTGRLIHMVHRDITPRNLLVGADGVVRIIDLGLGKSDRQDWHTATGLVMGSPGYMSPEQITAEKVDARADLFSLSVVFYELLTGEPYVVSNTPIEVMRAMIERSFIKPSQFRTTVPPSIDALFERAQAKEPFERFASAAEMRSAIMESGIELASEVEIAMHIDALFQAGRLDPLPDLSQLLERLPEAEPAEFTETRIYARRANVQPNVPKGRAHSDDDIVVSGLEQDGHSTGSQTMPDPSMHGVIGTSGVVIGREIKWILFAATCVVLSAWFLFARTNPERADHWVKSSPKEEVKRSPVAAVPKWPSALSRPLVVERSDDIEVANDSPVTMPAVSVPRKRRLESKAPPLTRSSASLHRETVLPIEVAPSDEGELSPERLIRQAEQLRKRLSNPEEQRDLREAIAGVGMLRGATAGEERNRKLKKWAADIRRIQERLDNRGQ